MEKLNGKALEVIDKIVDNNKNKMGPVKLMLHDIQHELGYIPMIAMEKVADACDVSCANVYGVVTFYSQFTCEPKGKHIINVCMGTACYVKGSQELLEKISDLCVCKVNKTSDDGLFSLDATRCLGACGLAPIALVDEKVYGNATSKNDIFDRINEIISNERV